MLIQFTFSNFRSFKDEATLSLVAASKLQADPDLDAGNVFQARERPHLDLLRVAALYGANASGKTNVAFALAAFKGFVMRSANLGLVFASEPFLFDTTSRDRPTFFEMTFLRNEVQYRYGFEIKQGDPQVEIISEWLYRAETATEMMLFERTGNAVRRGRRFTEGKALLTNGLLNRTDALFLSLTAQLGTKIASDVVRHVMTDINVLQGLEDDSLLDFTVQSLEQNRNTDSIQTLMRETDPSITRVVIIPDDGEEFTVFYPKELPKELVGWFQRDANNSKKRTRVISEHPVFNEDGVQVDTVQLPLKTYGSQGTQKQLAYAGPILNTLDRGSTLIIDEMDARFHPLLTRALVRLFQSPETNPKNAQLIFITHDTNLLDSKNLRRDQIWFVEKDRFGGSHLYTLSDFKGVRKDASFEEEYIQGRYGAIPFLGGLNKLFRPTDSSSEDALAGEAHAKA